MIQQLVLIVVCTLCCRCVGSSDTTPEDDSVIREVYKEISEIKFNIKPESIVIPDIRNDDQDDVDSRLWGGVNLKREAGRIRNRLRDLANNELGVTTLQGVFDSMQYADETEDLQSKVSHIGAVLESKLSDYRGILMNNKALIQSLYKFHMRSPISQNLSCCQLNTSILSEQSSKENSDMPYKIKTSLHTVCDLLPSDFTPLIFNPGRNLTAKFSQNIQRYPAVKWQYFISNRGVHNEFPAHEMNALGLHCAQAQNYRHREVFVGTVSPQPKNVVIMVDISSVLTPQQMMTAKELAKQTLLSLSYRDQVTVLALSHTVEAPPTRCDANSLNPASQISKYYLSDYIDSLRPASTLANHTLGVQAAFSVIPKGEPGVIIYISRGLMNIITEAQDVISIISRANLQHDGGVIIHTYGLIAEGTPVMYEKTFLTDISAQNFTKYSVEYTGPPITPGTYQAVSSPSKAASALTDLFLPEKISESDAIEVKISKPYNDLIDQGLVVSMSVTCVTDDHDIIGVAGLDLSLEDLVAKVTHTNNEGLYAFLIDLQGHVVMHPDIERTMSDRSTLTLINVTHFENLPGFGAIAQQMLTTQNGTAELLVNNATTSYSLYAMYHVTYVYSWYKVKSSPYIVVMRQTKNKDPEHKISAVSGSDSDGMVYHRLDLGQLPSDETCLHFQQLASFSTSALFLSAKAFEKPYEHISQPENKKMVSNYLAYIMDSSSYISKPGLKAGVKNDAIAISKVHKLWLKQWKTSTYSDFIIRRYVATPSGVFRMYPATLTSKLYEPTQSHWYRQATRLPGRIMLTRPYIDTAGSGYMITLSHSIYEGRSAALHTPRDPVAAVVGMDVPASYFNRLLLDLIPACSLSGIRCFMLDDKGYIISHPKLKLNNYQRSFEQQHLTHVEPLVANDILGHKTLVNKKQCNSFADRTVQRYYHFNTSLLDTVTNLKAGEQCVRYQMRLIPGSNSFIVMINETCAMRIAAFCPCSITDRLCLNCQRMEQSECECPCECPLTSDICTGELDYKEVSQPSCDLFTESNLLFKLPKALTQQVHQCVEPQCDRYNSERSCMGVVGCSWCSIDKDGVTPLDDGFCDVHQICFGGVLGARTPYNDQISLTSEVQSHGTFLKNTPVGPVTGAILGLVLIIAMSVYCYRHNINRRPLADLDPNDTSNCSGYIQENDEAYVYHELPAVPGPSGIAAAHVNMVDMEVAPAAHISPYHVNENYRPPRPVVTATESSDHGYSTMTAQEEAETSSQSANSCRESLVSYKSASTNKNTPSGSSTTSHKLPTIKILPPPKTSRNSRLKLHGSECKKLLPTETACRTIDEYPETERTQALNQL